jgi:hypothetical protein
MPRARLALALPRLLLAGFAVLVAGKALMLGAADIGLRSDPARVLQLDRGNPQAVLRLARDRAPADAVADDERGDAVRTALARAPLDGRLWRELAAAAGAGTTRGRAYLDTALRLRPADVRTRAWLADNAAAQGDLAAAATHVDAILRVAPQHAVRLFPLLQTWLRRDDGVAAVAATFSPAPAWRRGFFASAPAAPQRESVLAMAQLLLALRRGDAPPDLGEGVVVVDRLLALAEYERAWLLWQALQSADDRVGSQLRNGNFERELIGSGFDWILRRGGGASATVSTAPQRDSRALRVRFDERPLQGAAVAQTLLLAPGRYRLSGVFLADRIDRGAVVEWTIDCVAPRAQRVATAATVTAAAQRWSGFDLEFRVPDADCVAQRLQLQPRAAGLRGSGELWFDDFALVAAPATAGGP